MKKRKSLNFIVILLIFLFIPIKAHAIVPYKTLTLGPNWWFVETQTAYEPGEIIKLSMDSPEDIFIDEKGTLYVADTGNSRIIIKDEDGNLRSIGKGILSKPSGIFVDKTNRIFVADYGNKKVYIFDNNGEVLKEISKPDKPLYGKNTDFIPKKLVVDGRGNIYVISEGSINGLVQLNNAGEFIGYFGSNKTDTSLKMILQRIFFTEGQLGQLFKNIPPSPTNVAIDNQGLVYTATMGIKSGAIKKFNVSGINLLPTSMIGYKGMLDVAIDSFGNIFAVGDYGDILEYDSFGNIVFVFGGGSLGENRLGILKTPVAIEITKDHRIFILDKEQGIIQTFKPTQFANEVHKGISLYKEGLYIDSESYWKNILKMNSSFILPYKALGKSNFQRGNYKEALESFRLAEDVKGYSDAFWEIRNNWLQKNLASIIVGLFFLYILIKIIKWVDKKKGIFDFYRELIKKIKSIKIVSQLIFLKRFLKQPLDSYYDLRRKGKASVLSGTLLYLWLFILQIVSLYVTGYVFRSVNPLHTSVFNESIKVFIPIILFIISNYLVSTINDGEGRIKDIYIGTIYSFSPYLIFALPIILLSNVLTLNEAFVFSFSMTVLKGWTLVLLVIMIKEIHNFTFKETLRNIFVTIFGMVVITLVVFILYILIDQELDFIRSIIQELKIRV